MDLEHKLLYLLKNLLRYALYAGGEILLVVSGALIAIYILDKSIKGDLVLILIFSIFFAVLLTLSLKNLSIALRGILIPGHIH